MINKHKTSRVPGRPRDFVDCYLDELDKVCVCAMKSHLLSILDEKSCWTVLFYLWFLLERQQVHVQWRPTCGVYYESACSWNWHHIQHAPYGDSLPHGSSGHPESELSNDPLHYIWSLVIKSMWKCLYYCPGWKIQTKVLHALLLERCQQEIDEVLGNKPQPSFEDRHDMPYTQAMIHETQRIANTVPLSVFHCTTRDTDLMGYSIPKVTTLMVSMFCKTS